MLTSHAQMLLASAGYYRGAIDGDLGPKTRAAIQITESNDRNSDVRGWSWERRLVGAAQRILNAQGYQAGAVDGWDGHNTGEALIAWLSDRAGVVSDVARTPVVGRPGGRNLPTQAECATFYGQPGSAEIEARMTYAVLPFDLRIDWNLDQRTRKLRVHEKCADSLVAALIAVRDFYGLDRMQALGIDRYAGGYNPRRMRGGSSWSMHAYGCAVDFYAAPNALRMRCPQALFCGPDYRDFLDIMESHNWLPAVRLWGADAMHFQQARL